MYSKLEITQVVTGYLVVSRRDKEVKKTVHLDQPIEYTYKKFGVVFRVLEQNEAVEDSSDKAHETDEEDDDRVLASAHALTHVLAESSGMLTGGSEQDIDGSCEGDTGIIVLFDASPGGTGASKLLYGRLEETFRRAREILETCDCAQERGCPWCTMRFRCSKDNRVLSKKGAKELLDMIHRGEESKIGDKPLAYLSFIV